jgi:hypothetical protein
MTQTIQPNRRDFFKTVGLTAATAALPTGLIASGAALAQPATDLDYPKNPTLWRSSSCNWVRHLPHL